MNKIEIENRVQFIFDKVKHPFLSTISFVHMFEDLQKEVNLLVQSMSEQQIEEIKEKVIINDNLIGPSYENIERFFTIEVLRKIVEEYFMTISNMPGFKKFFWEYLESKGFTHADVFYK